VNDYYRWPRRWVLGLTLLTLAALIVGAIILR
jgi:hypothetical protein